MSGMIKNTLVVSIVATTASLAQAKMPMFHVGGGVGYGFAKTGATRDLKRPNIKPMSQRIKTDGTIGQLNIGADYFADNGFYTGMQLSGFLSDISGSKKSSTLIAPGGAQMPLLNKRSIKMRNGVQLDARFGKKMGDFVPHLILGMAVAKWKASSVDVVPRLNVNEKMPRSKNCFGFVLGGAVDYNLTDRFFVRGEYQYTWYKKLTINKPTQSPGQTTFKPRTSIAMLSVGWRFG
jgi:opacity protein-like surface antigen